MKKLWLLAILVVAVIAFTACRGNGGDDVTPDITGQETDANVEENGDDNIIVNENDNGNDNIIVNDDENGDDNIIGDDDDNGDDNIVGNEDDEDNGEEAPVARVILPARPADVVWSLSTDEYFQNTPIDTSGSSEDVLTTEYLVGAGNPTFRAVGNPLGGVALRLTHREQTWHAVDIITPELGLNTAANSYELTIRGNISEAGNVTVGGGDTPYATFFTHTSGAGNFTLTGTITADTIERAGSRRHLRVAVNNLGNLEIQEISIRRVDLVVPVEVPTRSANVVWSLLTDAEFQSLAVGTTGDGAAVFATPYLQNAGSPMFTVVNNPVGAGNALRVHNRTADWHTVDLHLGNMGVNLAANTYTIRVRGRIIDPPEGSTADLMGTGSPWARFAEVEVSGNGDFTVEANNVNAATMAENGSTDRVRLAASATAGEADYYIYEIEVKRN